MSDEQTPSLSPATPSGAKTIGFIYTDGTYDIIPSYIEQYARATFRPKQTRSTKNARRRVHDRAIRARVQKEKTETMEH